MVVLINYANKLYKRTQHFNSWTGKHIGKVDKVIEYGPEDIDEVFLNKNKDILNLKRGAGAWLWKPYIILKTLESVEDGDLVFYCDSGTFFCRSMKVLLEHMENQEIWVSNIPLIEKQFTKPEVFEILGATDDIKNSHQIQGGFIIVRKTNESVAFIQEWLEACENPRLLLSNENHEESGECISHREDQSILSVLCKKHGILPHKDPSQYGRLPEKYRESGRLFDVPEHDDDYAPIIVLHRTREVDLGIAFRQWLCATLPRSISLKLIK